MISRSTCCRAEVKFTKKISFISQCKYFIFLLSFITKKNRFSTFSSCSSYFMHSVFCFPVIIIVSEARQPASSLFAFLCVLILLLIIMVRIQTSLSLSTILPRTTRWILLKSDILYFSWKRTRKTSHIIICYHHVIHAVQRKLASCWVNFMHSRKNNTHVRRTIMAHKSTSSFFSVVLKCYI